MNKEMRYIVERGVNWFSKRVGFTFTRVKPKVGEIYIPEDFDADETEDLKAVSPYTMTTPERIVTASRAVRYVVENKIPGSIVECGVWRGGSIMVMLRTLMRMGDQSRDVYLFDTFEGMSTPTKHDVGHDGEMASLTYKRQNATRLVATLDEVKRNVLSVGYNPNKIHFIKGKVEDTIPATLPQQIALLRLDTDWYESTIHELNHLYPNLAHKGIMIIDDYGHWKGSKKAVDEYLEREKLGLFLNRVDYSCRLAVKL